MNSIKMVEVFELIEKNLGTEAMSKIVWDSIGLDVLIQLIVQMQKNDCKVIDTKEIIKEFCREYNLNKRA